MHRILFFRKLVRFPVNVRPINLVSASLTDLHAELESLNEPKFRANQIYEWVRHKGVTDPKQMTNLPLALRHKVNSDTLIIVFFHRIFTTLPAISNQLSQLPPTTNLTCVTERKSRDGTIKRAYKLSDGQLIESVLMSYRDGRHTACISSQAGCAMGCVFCATGGSVYTVRYGPQRPFALCGAFMSSNFSNRPNGICAPAYQRRNI